MAEYVTQAELVAAVANLSQEINTLLAGLSVLRPVQGDYITNQEAVDLVNQTLDTWHDLLWDTLTKLTELVDQINGEVVYDNLVAKIQEIESTKQAIRDKIGSSMPNGVPFRVYPDYIEEGGGGGGSAVIIPLAINKAGVYNASTYVADGFDPVTAGGYMPVVAIDGIDRLSIPWNISVEVVN